MRARAEVVSPRANRIAVDVPADVAPGERFELPEPPRAALVVGPRATYADTRLVDHDPWRPRLALEIPIEPSDRLYGCGERPGPLDRRGRRLTGWNTDPVPVGHSSSTDPFYTSFPFVLVLRGERAFAILLDHDARFRIDLACDAPDVLRFEIDGERLAYVVLEGPSPRDVVREVTRLTGMPPLPPRWALGYHQSRWSYATEAEVRDVADALDAHRIPCDAIHLDIDCLDRFRVFSWNRAAFPDPAGLARDLAARGMRLARLLDPGLQTDEDHATYAAARAAKLLVSDDEGAPITGPLWEGRQVAFPDFFDARARAFWSNEVRALADRDGISGFVCDMCEPGLFDASAREHLAKAGRHTLDDGRRVAHAEVHNAFGTQFARATYEGLRARGERPFVLTRSGGTGMQAFSAMWTGDNDAWFEHLGLALRQVTSLALVGMSFAGCDLGGFWGPTEPELLVRFLELGAVLPFCRNHSAKGTPRQEPYAFGEPTTSMCRRAIELRMRLLPYLVTAFHAWSRDGDPVLGPMFVDHAGEPRVAAAEDQAMLGRDLLIAPVLERGARERLVTLPTGRWIRARLDAPSSDDKDIDVISYEREGSAIFEGGRVVACDVALGEGPAIFARTGTVLPLARPALRASAPPDRIELHVLGLPEPGVTTSGRLDEDDGISLDYERGAIATTRFSCTRAPGDPDPGAVVVVIEPREGAYVPPPRELAVVLHGPNGRVIVELGPDDGGRREVRVAAH